MIQENTVGFILQAVHQRGAAVPGEALRLFNGFYEGYPQLAIDRYADTIVLQSFRKEGIDPVIRDRLLESFSTDSTVSAVLLKERFGATPLARNGVFLKGDQTAERIREFGVNYRINLLLNRDCSFYLDSANVRKYLLENTAGKTVLNTFAYTGSLGLAALAGGAKKVIQTDLNSEFLTLYEQTAREEGINPTRYESIVGDFFSLTTMYRKNDVLFDLIILDPPMFSVTKRGRVDLQGNFISTINKVRSLVAHEGTLLVINNALYLSGADFLNELRSGFPSEYVQIGAPIPVPDSFIGGSLDNAHLPANPAPFNHPTKIIPLTIRRKDERRA